MKNKFTKPLLAFAALATIGAGAGASAIVSAQTPTTSGTTAQVRPDRAPGVHGKITAISGNTITVSDEHAGTTYSVDASAATITKASEGAAPATATISALAVGDMIGVEGTVSGTSVAATKIMSGFMGGKGFGGSGMHGGRGTAGTVTAVNGNTITLTGDNGTSYTVDASAAKVSKVVDVTVSDIKVGDRIGAEGTLSGTTVIAQHIMTGIPAMPTQPAVQQ